MKVDDMTIGTSILGMPIRPDLTLRKLQIRARLRLLPNKSCLSTTQRGSLLQKAPN